MTAEIAVLNRSAVALAADSAVTIGRPPNSKIYNTVNKIFELSGFEPVGLMIYGRLDYMGLPLETLIKTYRSKLGRRKFDHISGYRDDFMRFIRDEVECIDKDQDECVMMILYDVFQACNKKIEILIMEDIRKRGRYLKSKENRIAQIYLNEKIRELKSKKFAPGFNSKKFPDKHRSVLDQAQSAGFTSITPNEKTKHLIEEYGGYFLSKETLSALRTGIVVVGFGDKELCPTLECFEIDGVIDGKLKYVHITEVDIAKGGPQADILGFAQDDMMESFVDGIDPSIKLYFERTIKKAVLDNSHEVLKSVINDDTKAKDALETLRPVLEKIANDVTEKANAYIKKQSSEPIRDMIRAMPKQELSTLAESLIEITSLKRKVTREQETVGGEVDVAIISKSEGFVWVKRKHYFPKEINARFFNRHYQKYKEEDSHEPTA